MGSALSRVREYCIYRIIGRDLRLEYISSDCVTILIEDVESDSHSINSDPWIIRTYTFYCLLAEELDKLQQNGNPNISKVTRRNDRLLHKCPSLSADPKPWDLVNRQPISIRNRRSFITDNRPALLRATLRGHARPYTKRRRVHTN